MGESGKTQRISQEDIGRQLRFCEKLRELNEARPGGPPLACVQTYGCQQNVADSQRLMGMLRDMGCGFTQDPGRAEIIVINTCAIRENAEKKVFGVVGQLVHAKERNPDLTICLCGCMAQQETAAARIRASYRHVDLVFGPQALWRFPELLFEVRTRHKRVFSIAQERGAIAEGLPVVRESGVKAWVSIMYGCNNFCSYCIVPYVRGRERSAHVAKQLHLPVQSGSSRVLRAMNRGYTREQYLEKAAYARSVMPELVLTSDIIIGFPGETEEEAMETISLIREVRYDALFTFIYSPRPGTPAASLPDTVSRAEKQVWFDKLLEEQNRISGELHRAYVGRRLRVLVDGESGDEQWPLSSRTHGGRLVHLRGDASLIGQYVDAEILDSNTWALFGAV